MAMTPARPIIVIGAVNADIYGHHAEQPASVTDSVPGSIYINAGGVGRNIAENLARLGLDVSFVGCFGGDDFSQMLQASLTDSQTDITASYFCEDASDMYISLFNHQGEMISAVNQMRCIEKIDPEYLAQKDRLLSTASCLIMDGNLSLESLSYLVHRPKSCFVAADMVSVSKAVKFQTLLPHIDLVKCNQIEAAACCEMSADTKAEALCSALLDKGAKGVLLSIGAGGFMVAWPEDRLFIPAGQPEQIGNSSGTGDALLAGFIYGLETGRDMRQAGILAGQLALYTFQEQSAVSAKGCTILARGKKDENGHK